MKIVKTIIISDLHLGITDSKADEIVHFLSDFSCENLIMNGDIIDGWELKKYGKWKPKHTRFFKFVMKIMEENQTKVWYLHGNHDDFLDNILPLQIGNFSLQMDYIYESFGKKYFIVHGDIFDSITSNVKWLAKIGSLAYIFSLWLNKGLNFLLKKIKIKPVFISQYLKTKVKSIFSPKNSYQKKLVQMAKSKNCEAIVCGHIHKPSIQNFDGILYMNSGDWVESMSALVENLDGTWELLHYKDIFSDLKQRDNEIFANNEKIDKTVDFYVEWIKSKV
ncbi:MAG: UDP-2,3-diacylglucosamine diphosphatase [Bacteroidetes bacterium]|nr:MAG: UDP-2,3-diacylglucosamine diphosphatase [Bacteroidota bacterium]TAG88750.1 MAG: UDP-2,3-diacylglucosamine diphosphatase [Bacteroidota bacterium]